MSLISVQGPVSGGRHGWPFGAATRDVAAEGYAEEEFFFSGDAPRYRAIGEFGIDGEWAAERAGSAPFVTRALVRRPIDAARFNGTVVVEWNNVSAGFEIFEAGDTSAIFDEGFAYVGVSAQRVGVHGHPHEPQGLRAWDAERYGDLEIGDDAVSYGIFTAVARALRGDRAGADPLGGLRVCHLLGIGGSQSAGRLATYVNVVQRIEKAFDGFVLFTWFGSGMSIDDPRTVNLADPESRAAIRSLPTRLRDDLDVPVMIVNTECEALSLAPVRQADTDRRVTWEVAGAPHGPRLHMERIGAKLLRDEMSLAGAASAPQLELSQMGPVAFAPVLDAALTHLHRWMDGGQPPPSQPLIELEGDPRRVRRDDDGNAIGGIRLPEHEVSLTRNVGSIEEAGAAGLIGVTTPLPAEVIRRRYPDLDSYVSAFSAAADRAVAGGVLSRRDADEAIERAKTVSLP